MTFISSGRRPRSKGHNPAGNSECAKIEAQVLFQKRYRVSSS